MTATQLTTEPDRVVGFRGLMADNNSFEHCATTPHRIHNDSDIVVNCAYVSVFRCSWCSRAVHSLVVKCLDTVGQVCVVT